MKLLRYFTSVLFLSISFCLYGETIPANNKLIEYTGRIDFSDALAPSFSYSGTSIRASFEGRSISIILNDKGIQNYYNIILDNKVVKRIQTVYGKNTYLISDNLNDTIHEIEIFRLTEQMFGKTYFYGFEIENGKNLLELTNKRNLLIEFIGNSITCGYGNEGKLGEKFGPTTENHFMTYAAITSRSFNARHLPVCKSGIGIYRNWDGPKEGNIDCMPNYYKRIFLYDSLPLYNFKQKPDLICIDLGTNDFSTEGGDSTRYVSNYLRFIDSLQLINKKADIICLLGPMLKENDLIRVRKYLNVIVNLANSKENGKVYFFEMSEQLGDLGIGTDSHPTVAQNLKNAKELVSFISKIKGWKTLNPILDKELNSTK